MSTNMRNPAIRRIMADMRELNRHPSSRYHAQPLEDDPFEWHFTIRGPDDSDFAGGVYHGRILLPAEYPMKPPNIVFLTSNGRFEVGTKICLSMSAYHEETWQAAWGVRTMLEALISFFPSEGAGAIGALDYSSEERKKLARDSVGYCCSLCGTVVNLLSAPPSSKDDQPDSVIAAQVAQLCMTRPQSSSSRFNTTGVLDDIPSHQTHADHVAAAGAAVHAVGLSPEAVTTDLPAPITESLSSIVGNGPSTISADQAMRAMSELALNNIEHNLDEDATLEDMLDIDVVETSGKLTATAVPHQAAIASAATTAPFDSTKSMATSVDTFPLVQELSTPIIESAAAPEVVTPVVTPAAARPAPDPPQQQPRPDQQPQPQQDLALYIGLVDLLIAGCIGLVIYIITGIVSRNLS